MRDSLEPVQVVSKTCNEKETFTLTFFEDFSIKYEVSLTLLVTFYYVTDRVWFTPYKQSKNIYYDNVLEVSKIIEHLFIILIIIICRKSDHKD